MNEILTIDQVAESLQMSGEQVRQLIKSGELPVGFRGQGGRAKAERAERAKKDAKIASRPANS